MGISIFALVRSRVTQLSNVLSLPSPLGKGDHAVVDEVESDGGCICAHYLSFLLSKYVWDLRTVETPVPTVCARFSHFDNIKLSHNEDLIRVIGLHYGCAAIPQSWGMWRKKC